MQRLSSWMDVYDQQMILYALYEAGVYDKRSLDYIERILAEWKRKGLTPADYEEGRRPALPKHPQASPDDAPPRCTDRSPAPCLPPAVHSSAPSTRAAVQATVPASGSAADPHDRSAACAGCPADFHAKREGPCSSDRSWWSETPHPVGSRNGAAHSPAAPHCHTSARCRTGGSRCHKRSGSSHPSSADRRCGTSQTPQAAYPFHDKDVSYRSSYPPFMKKGRYGTPYLPVSCVDYSMISVTFPAPTVRPPSRIENFVPFSMAIGAISSTVISTLSPGITMSVPSGSVMTPVTSVVRK